MSCVEKHFLIANSKSTTTTTTGLITQECSFSLCLRRAMMETPLPAARRVAARPSLRRVSSARGAASAEAERVARGCSSAAAGSTGGGSTATDASRGFARWPEDEAELHSQCANGVREEWTTPSCLCARCQARYVFFFDTTSCNGLLGRPKTVPMEKRRLRNSHCIAV